ncbi:uncharacterized protein HMPREF1541_10286 [Cyphellophora europaea CBS 101466]|uniref:L-ornithine N(5)-oxygenase n=1 Tax=Cyphellophora europaea (strain CBS 101466) TaxID=1220924 RepID=W2S7D1_CYPE1|nr:uncharacterized protein HMPREF1541_10286 [Cyphellophora europaea CBS 101466]ETN44616.1 hypothetical protein HMPREF1541_10286 [Cyphellophora europaea CBS 101466]
MDSQYDLIIVGAGIHGLILAKTYLEASPTSSLLIIDSAVSIGGVWAKERLYPGLKTNNLVGSYEFSDYALDPARYGLKPGQHIPGTVVHSYLSDFALHFNLMQHIRLNTYLETAELSATGSWLLTLTKTDPPSHSGTTLTTRRLTLATGLTSLPNMPTFPAQDTFDRPILHSLHLRQSSRLISTATSVAVLGGNKSAFDTAYSAATSGSEVHMIMRPSGGGPSWVWPVAITPWKLSVQRMATTRLFTAFDPTPSVHGWTWSAVRYLLQRTWIGHNLIVAAFWWVVGWSIIRANGYDDPSCPELRKLKPWTGVKWMGNSLSIHNYPTNFFDLVREGRVRVHIADITRLSQHAVHLSDGDALENLDALVCCTGWQVKPSVRFFPETLVPHLGLPGVPNPSITVEDITAADREILRQTPMLRRAPVRTLPHPIKTPTPLPPPGAHKRHGEAPPSPGTPAAPWRLYHHLVPIPSSENPHHNVAFLGTHLSVAATLVAQAQALWLTAYFLQPSPSDPNASTSTSKHYPKLPLLPSPETMKRQMLLETEYQRLRHPPEAGGAGERCPDLVFESLAVVDELLGEVGVERFRKRRGGKSWWREVGGRYWPGDYRGLVGEWLGLRDE